MRDCVGKFITKMCGDPSYLILWAIRTITNLIFRPEAEQHEVPMTSPHYHPPWDWVTQENFRRMAYKAQEIPFCFQDDVYEALAELQRQEAEAYRLRQAEAAAEAEATMMISLAALIAVMYIVALLVSSGVLGNLFPRRRRQDVDVRHEREDDEEDDEDDEKFVPEFAARSVYGHHPAHGGDEENRIDPAVQCELKDVDIEESAEEKLERERHRRRLMIWLKDVYDASISWDDPSCLGWTREELSRFILIDGVANERTRRLNAYDEIYDMSIRHWLRNLISPIWILWEYLSALVSYLHGFRTKHSREDEQLESESESEDDSNYDDESDDDDDDDDGPESDLESEDDSKYYDESDDDEDDEEGINCDDEDTSDSVFESDSESESDSDTGDDGDDDDDDDDEDHDDGDRELFCSEDDEDAKEDDTDLEDLKSVGFVRNEASISDEQMANIEVGVGLIEPVSHEDRAIDSDDNNQEQLPEEDEKNEFEEDDLVEAAYELAVCLLKYHDDYVGEGLVPYFRDMVRLLFEGDPFDAMRSYSLVQYTCSLVLRIVCRDYRAPLLAVEAHDLERSIEQLIFIIRARRSERESQGPLACQRYDEHVEIRERARTAKIQQLEHHHIIRSWRLLARP